MRKIYVCALLLFVGCAGTAVGLIAFTERTYHFCTPEEVPGTNPANGLPLYVGKLCHNDCEAYAWFGLSDNCKKKKWKRDVKDVCTQKDNDQFMVNDFQVVPNAMLD